MYATTMSELKAQRDELNKQIAEYEWLERKDAIEKVRSFIAENKLTQADVFPVEWDGSIKGIDLAPGLCIP